MKSLDIHIPVRLYTLDELPPEDQQLVEAACEATKRSYAPYSHFSVGAAVRLANGIIVTGTNQENAAHPSGMCAERTTLFYANSQYPDQPVIALAIVARTSDGKLTDVPVSPCGACRQVMQETENRFGHSFKVLLRGAKGVYAIEKASDLLPLSFGSEFLK